MSQFTVILLCFILGEGYTQTVQTIPCYSGTGCASGDVGTQFTVFDCCSMPSTFSYRPAIGAEACLPCHAFGWVQNISSDLTSAEPQTDITAVEGETVTLTLFFTKNNPANFIRFDFNIATSGTATEGVDYVITPDPNQFISDVLFISTDPVTVNVTLLSDGVGGEGSEEIGITLVQLSPVEPFRVLTRPTVTITVRDNDFQTGFLIVEDDCVTEGEVQEICLRTVGTPAIDTVLDVTVTYNTAAPEDFNLITSQVTITATNTQPCVRFEAVADSLGLEGVENLTLTLSGPPNVQLTTPTADICIQEPDVVISFEPTSYTVTEGDDGFAELILVRSGYLDRTTIITVTTADGSATAGSDYTTTSEEITFEAGSTRTTVTVPITDDNEVENEKIFTAVLSSSESNNIMIGEDIATVTIFDNDVVVSFDPTSYIVTEGDGGFVELILVRSGDLRRATVVTVTTADGSATAGFDYTTTSVEVTFRPDSATAVVRVPITDDNEVENEEAFTAVLSSSDSHGEDIATVMILDDDVVVSFEKTSYTVTEGKDEFVEVTLVRSGDLSSNTTVTLTTFDVSALAGLDYSYTKEVVTFVPGETVALVRIPIVDNTAVESDEMFIAALSSEDNNVVIDGKSVTIMILDPDSIRGGNASSNSGAIIAATIIAVATLLITTIIVASILTYYYRKKRQKKVELQTPEIRDDPESPCFTYNSEKKVSSSAISAKEQPQTKQSFAYDALQPEELPSAGVQAEDQC